MIKCNKCEIEFEEADFQLSCDSCSMDIVENFMSQRNTAYKRENFTKTEQSEWTTYDYRARGKLYRVEHWETLRNDGSGVFFFHLAAPDHEAYSTPDSQIMGNAEESLNVAHTEILKFYSLETLYAESIK